MVSTYKTELIKKGWNVMMAVEKGKMASLMLNKEKQTLMVSAGQRGEVTRVTIRLSGQK